MENEFSRYLSFDMKINFDERWQLISFCGISDRNLEISCDRTLFPVV